MESNGAKEILGDITLDYSEIAIDAFLDEGVMKEIPVIKTLYSIFKAGKSIKDYYTMKKLSAFFTGCVGIESDNIKSFVSKLDDEKYCAEIGTRVLLLVDKVDAIEKAVLIGKALVLLVNSKIEPSFYLRLCKMIDRCFYDDIKNLSLFKDKDTIITLTNEAIPTISLESLFSIGLLSNFGFDGGDASGKNSGTRFGLNDYGEILKSILQTSSISSVT